MIMKKVKTFKFKIILDKGTVKLILSHKNYLSE